jgi:hypothetical protein
MAGSNDRSPVLTIPYLPVAINGRQTKAVCHDSILFNPSQIPSVEIRSPFAPELKDPMFADSCKGHRLNCDQRNQRPFVGKTASNRFLR